MKLLILTQKVDINDNNLGFFHRWIEEFAKHCESIIVVCLQKGEYHLPFNVKILSSGKEKKYSRIRYLWNFYKYIFSERGNYDAVFVHMNKEYVLLGGPLWKLWNKKIALWYTHKAVGWQLKLAEKLVDKIFTASKESFRLPSSKVEITGHGIDVEHFDPAQFPSFYDLQKELRLLAVGRISPVKDFATVIKGLTFFCNNLLKRDINPDYVVSLNIIGEPITEADKFYQSEIVELKNKQGVSWYLNFMGGQSYNQMPLHYNRHHILIHTSRTGSIDKVVLEALASGRLVITSSEAFADLAKEGLVYTFPEGDYQELAKTIEKIYNSGIILLNKKGVDFVKKNHNLADVIVKILNYFK